MDLQKLGDEPKGAVVNGEKDDSEADSGGNGSEVIALTDKQIERFWRKIEKTEGCWFWRGAIQRTGYGNFWGRKCYLSHRISWFIHNGPIPDGLFVLHRCDVRNCVAPHHLWVGTNTDNMRDMESKGRSDHPSGLRNGRYTKPESTLRGERHGMAALSKDDVIEIRKIYKSTYPPTKEIAIRFGVTRQNIRRIITRKTWQHV